MNYENVVTILRELDALKEQTNIPGYDLSIDGLIKQMDVLKNIEGNPVIIIDNRYDEKLNKHALTYLGKLSDKFLLPTGSIVSDGLGPRIKIQFQPETLNQFYYIDRGYAISLKAVPGEIGYAYPHSEIIFKEDDVKKKLNSEHYKPVDLTIEEFIESLKD